MIIQAAGIWLTVLVPVYGVWIVAAALQGLGTAMVYPTLLAAITDHAHPTWRASHLRRHRVQGGLGYAGGPPPARSRGGSAGRATRAPPRVRPRTCAGSC